MHHVILGAGPAGVIAAETIRKHQPRDAITIVGDEKETPYSRMAIPYLLMALEANLAGAYIDRSLDLLSGQDFGFDSRANALDRAAAIDRGYAWYAQHAKELEAQ